MTRLQHLTALRDKVKAGEWGPSRGPNEAWIFPVDFPEIGLEPDQARNMAMSYEGHLDAAKALHEALLPGMGWTLTSHNQARILQEMPPFVYVDFQDGETPARAWLLAILSALMRKETEI